MKVTVIISSTLAILSSISSMQSTHINKMYEVMNNTMAVLNTQCILQKLTQITYDVFDINQFPYHRLAINREDI